MKISQEKNKDCQAQCAMCEAKFQVWLSNAKFSDEKKEKIGEHLLQYCPDCSKILKK